MDDYFAAPYLRHPEAAPADAALADVPPVVAQVLLVNVLPDLAKVHPILLLPQLGHGVTLLLLTDPASSNSLWMSNQHTVYCSKNTSMMKV